MCVGKLLVRSGKLRGVIDFGQWDVGDPACDLCIAWTLFNGESRAVFRAMLPFAAGLTNTDAVESAHPLWLIAELLDDGTHTP